MINKGIQEKRLGITMTNYGHHVRVALKKNQTSLRLEKAIFKQFLLNEESDVEVLTLSGGKFHSLEARKAKVRLLELVLVFGRFKVLLAPQVSMLCTLLYSYM